ncbi:MAG: hypothetical protein IKG03_01765 [Clostridiales bacterium]|nr:hypothetical protein [Clostridiales bacterium]
MIVFACTVKDLFRRPRLLNETVRKLADHGFAGHAVTYAFIRDKLSDALAYAAGNMRDHEYKAAMAYLESCYSEIKVARRTHYTPRSLRRYIHRACELIGEYYSGTLGIRFLPNGCADPDCSGLTGQFWDKVSQMADQSIESALVVIKCCHEKKSMNYVCSNYGLGNIKVKRIVKEFNENGEVCGILTENIKAV